MMRYWGNNMMGWGSGYGFFGGIISLFFWILIIVGIVLLVKWLISQQGVAKGPDKTPLDILKERYAKGEISKEEFETRKKDLAG